MKKEHENHMDRYARTPIINIVVVGLFAAICYVAILLLHIPYPAPVGNPFIHFGNLFVILAALLFGGWQGGLAGSIGMGFFDITTGYGWATIKTVILKFGIGWITGLIARFGRKNPDKNPRFGLFVTAGVSILTGAGILLGKIFLDSFSKISDIAYIFLFALGVILASIAFLAKKLTNDILFSTLGAVGGIAFNVVGEYIGGIIMKVIAGSNLAAASLASLLSLPATLINGSFSIVGAVLLYIPLKEALRKTGLRSMGNI